MPRELSSAERSMLEAVILRADADGPVTNEDRARWLQDAQTMLVGAGCGCGCCPSIELLAADGAAIEGDGRIVLSASITDGRGGTAAIVLLFVDSDRPSYLELAPVDDEAWAEFPAPASLV